MSPRRLAVWVAAVLFVAGAVAEWTDHSALVTYPHGRCVSTYANDLPEYSRLASSEISLAPPGTRCAFVDSTGATFERTYVPWFEWFANLVLAILVAVVVGGVAALVRRRRRRGAHG